MRLPILHLRQDWKRSSTRAAISFSRAITKEYLASEIKTSEATISNISTELKKQIDGSYELDEAFAKCLTVEKEQILSQLDQFPDKALGNLDDDETRKDLEESLMRI